MHMPKFKANGNHRRALQRIIDHKEWGDPSQDLEGAVKYLEALMNDEEPNDEWVRDVVVSAEIFEYSWGL